MKLAIYQIDAFANKLFEGNPAAVIPLKNWLPDELMQAIAGENNLSETAFFVRTHHHYAIRWFTPTHEVNLCGHATLASAHVILNYSGHLEKSISFESKSGPLTVRQKNDWLEMDFPSQPATPCSTPEQIIMAFNEKPVECLQAEDYIVVFENENSILNANPDMSLLAQLDLRGVAITARAQKFDFISRFFAPKYAINEDPVTGSSFTQLIPYWSNQLNSQSLQAKQVSMRGGEVGCVNAGNRVLISGKAVTYMTGFIEIEV
jgi:PhzF family phenazine biosynthesis protein